MKKIKNKGYSLIELIISAIIIALITSATVPIFFKKNSIAKMKIKNRISLNCPPELSNCQLCRKNAADNNYKCVICTKVCSKGEYLKREDCTCHNCSEYDEITPFSSSSRCDNCCIRCNSSFCTGCNLGIGLQDRAGTLDKNMGCRICNINTYSDNNNGLDEKCKNCPENSTTKNKTRRTRAGECICNGGYYRTAKDTIDIGLDKACKNCGAGYYCPDSSAPDSDLESPRRKLCQAPYYCEGPNNSTQQTCPNGSATHVNGATSIKQCSCSTNSYKVNYDAATGYFKECKVCEPGNYCDGTYKHPCRQGRYCPNTGMTTEPLCPANNYCPNPTTIYGCPPPGYSNAGSWDCSQCGCHNSHYKSGCSCQSCSNPGNGNCCTNCVSGQNGCIAGTTGVLLNGQCYRHPANDTDCVNKFGNNFMFSAASGGFCIQTRNTGASEEGSIDILYGSEVDCDNSLNRCCWKSDAPSYDATIADHTSIPAHCTGFEYVPYTGCSRAVCTPAAASVLCSEKHKYGITSELPTPDELKYIYDNQRSSFNFCSTSVNDEDYHKKKFTYCPDRHGSDSNSGQACKGGGTSQCSPGRLYTASGTTVYVNDYRGTKYHHVTTEAHRALSVRCLYRWMPDN